MLRIRAIVVLSAALVASGASGLSVGTGQAGVSAGAELTRATSLEELVLRRINGIRATRGLAPLALSAQLSRSAAGHSRSMATLGYFSHESQDGASFSERIRRSYPRTKGWSVGENLAMFIGSPPTAGGIVAAWMASPSHRANLLRGLFREAGIGVIFNAAAGGVFAGEPTWVVTLDFGRR